MFWNKLRLDAPPNITVADAQVAVWCAALTSAMFRCRRLSHAPEPPVLNHELWAKVFANLEPGDIEAYSEIEPYMQYHKLRLVSKQFREVFQQNSRLSRFVSMHGPVERKVLTNLLEWLSVESTPVERLSLAGIGSEFQDIILGALMSRPQRPCLQIFRGTNLSDTGINLLAKFGSLVSCFIELNPANYLDLAPLHALSHLRDLHLTALGTANRFSNLHTLSYLTALTLDDTRMGLEELPANCGFISTLQTLNLFDSVIGIHSSGLGACESLKKLVLLDASVTAASASAAEGIDNAWHMVEGFPTRVPANMSNLSHLTFLALRLPRTAEPSDLDWVYDLKNLKELNLQSAQDMVLCAGLTKLSQLNLLSLSAHGDALCPGATWHLAINWIHMISLGFLFFKNCSFAVGSNFGELALVPCLCSIEIEDCRPADSAAFSNFLDLMRRLRSCRQDVHVWVDGVDQITIS